MSSESESKKSKWSKIKSFFVLLPKVVKVIGFFGILFLIFGVGIIGTSVIYNTKVTKFGLENVGELVTQTAHLTILQDSKVHRDLFNKFQIPFTESRQIFSYDVDVDASVDFSKISYEIKNDEIVVSLPHAKIYKATLDIDSLQIYLDEESLFSRIDLQKHGDALKEIEEKAIKTARKNGILESADKNAQKLIEGFIKSNKKYKEYVISYVYVGELLG